MGDALLVRGYETGGDHAGALESLGAGELAAAQTVPQRLAVQQFTDKVWRSVMNPDVVDGKNVGVIEGANRTGLLFESSQSVRVSGESCRKGLDRDFTIEP